MTDLFILLFFFAIGVTSVILLLRPSLKELSQRRVIDRELDELLQTESGDYWSPLDPETKTTNKTQEAQK